MVQVVPAHEPLVVLSVGAGLVPGPVIASVTTTLAASNGPLFVATIV